MSRSTPNVFKFFAFFLCFIEPLHLNICEIHNVIQLFVRFIISQLIATYVLFCGKIFVLFPMRTCLRTDVRRDVRYRPIS